MGRRTASTPLTQQMRLACPGTATIRDLVLALVVMPAGTSAFKMVSTVQQLWYCSAHGSNILDAEAFLEELDDHLELAALASIAGVWHR